MTTFLFWNILKKPLQDLVGRVARQHAVDVVILAECAISPDLVTAALGDQGVSYRHFPNEGGKVAVYSRLSGKSLSAKFSDPLGGLTVWELRVGSRPFPLLATVHFPDKLSWDADDQPGGAFRLARTIVSQEQRLRTSRTILVGDLNMNPFESGVVSAFGLHALMTKASAVEQNGRVVKGVKYPTFYNPMWGFFGDRTVGAPGTFYLRSSKPRNYFWNMYDQVMLRPGLADRLVKVEILDGVDTESLLTKKGRPDKARASDHLPVLFALDL